MALSRHVAAIPYPGRGHINPMMNVCRLLLTSSEGKDLLISFVVTEEWLGLISSSGDPPPPENLRLVSIPNTIPSEFGRAKDFAGFLDAVCTRMEGPVEGLMDSMEQPVEGILADTYLPWAVRLGKRRKVPVFSLFPMSASFFSVLYWWDKIPPARDGRRVIEGEEDELLGKYVPGHNSTLLSDVLYIFTSDATWRRSMEAFSMVREAQCILFTSFYEIESRVIDALRQNLHCPVYPIGPSIPYMLNEKPDDSEVDYIGWLNSQPKQSVLYISLGSFLSVSATQMDEIAIGLNLSGTRFLWVARGDSPRLQELVGGNGIVVPWCIQLKVLSHDSIGGFLTHCGWNSTLEGVFCGVPMITLPIFWDQLVGSRLIVDEWKVGLSLKGEVVSDGMIGHEHVALIVKRLMSLDSAESKELRKRAAKLREFARGAIVAGGSSAENIDFFVRDLIMWGNGC